MVISRLTKTLGCTALALAVCVSLAGCAGGASDIGDTSQGTAATVNGKPIGEKAVTRYIEDFRKSNSLESEEAWAEWMIAGGYTASKVREEVVDYYVTELLYDQAAKENDIVIKKAQIDEAVEKEKSRFDSEDAWRKALAASNMTEKEYRSSVVEPSLLQQALIDAVVSSEEPSDEELLALAQTYGPMYDGARRSSHILFAPEDSGKAQQVLDDINSGAISFEDAAKEHSIDGSAENGGDVGWDMGDTFVEEYSMALSALESGQVSQLVTSDYGIHIIKCTEVFAIPEGGVTSLDQVPSAVLDKMRLYAAGEDRSAAFLTWFDEYKDTADIQINEMPSKLPYDIDLSPYTE